MSTLKLTGMEPDDVEDADDWKTPEEAEELPDYDVYTDRYADT